MKSKNIFLILFISSITLYVTYLYIQERKEKSASECKSESCVRFCKGSNLSISLESDSKFKNLNPNYEAIVNDYCEEQYEIEEDWFFAEDGIVKEVVEDIGESFVHHEYCLNYKSDENFSIYGCFIDTVEIKLQHFHPYFILTSVPFLILTMTVYFLLPNLLNISGKSFMCYLASLLVSYLFYGFTMIFHDQLFEHNLICQLLGYFSHTSFLMCFLWLNILCFDIWLSFGHTSTNESNKLFWRYCIYGFGIPVFASILNFLLHKHDLIPDKFRHTLGHETCLIIGTEVNYIYLAIPLTITISINVILFTMTAYKIYTIQRSSTIVPEFERTTRNELKINFYLYLRLFVIMGISWIFEVISMYIKPNILLSLITILNCIQGVLIFCIFVWRSSVINALKLRFSPQNDVNDGTIVMSDIA